LRPLAQRRGTTCHEFYQRFDTLALQGNEEREDAKILAELDGALEAFKKKMGSLYDKTMVVTVTEFDWTA